VHISADLSQLPNHITLFVKDLPDTCSVGCSGLYRNIIMGDSADECSGTTDKEVELSSIVNGCVWHKQKDTAFSLYCQKCQLGATRKNWPIHVPNLFTRSLGDGRDCPTLGQLSGIPALEWWDTEFVGSYSELLRHFAYCREEKVFDIYILPPLSWSGSMLPKNIVVCDILGSLPLKRYGAHAFTRKHYCFLEFLPQDKIVVVYDGLNCDLSHWFRCITLNLKSFGFAPVRNKIIYFTSRSRAFNNHFLLTPRARVQNTDNNSWFVMSSIEFNEKLKNQKSTLFGKFALRPVLRQHDSTECGPLCLILLQKVQSVTDGQDEDNKKTYEGDFPVIKYDALKQRHELLKTYFANVEVLSSDKKEVFLSCCQTSQTACTSVIDVDSKNKESEKSDVKAHNQSENNVVGSFKEFPDNIPDDEVGLKKDLLLIPATRKEDIEGGNENKKAAGVTANEAADEKNNKRKKDDVGVVIQAAGENNNNAANENKKADEVTANKAADDRNKKKKKDEEAAKKAAGEKKKAEEAARKAAGEKNHAGKKNASDKKKNNSNDSESGATDESYDVSNNSKNSDVKAHDGSENKRIESFKKFLDGSTEVLANEIATLVDSHAYKYQHNKRSYTELLPNTEVERMEAASATIFKTKEFNYPSCNVKACPRNDAIESEEFIQKKQYEKVPQTTIEIPVSEIVPFIEFYTTKGKDGVKSVGVRWKRKVTNWSHNRGKWVKSIVSAKLPEHVSWCGNQCHGTDNLFANAPKVNLPLAIRMRGYCNGSTAPFNCPTQMTFGIPKEEIIRMLNDDHFNSESENFGLGNMSINAVIIFSEKKPSEFGCLHIIEKSSQKKMKVQKPVQVRSFIHSSQKKTCPRWLATFPAFFLILDFNFVHNLKIGFKIRCWEADFQAPAKV
jgi:hypothetical protein